ncbi:MAG TPA: hypothetical protein DD412_06030 [Holosporales bacterium]|nr:hypothetical protein [Holosporales bacterium]
MVTALRRDFTTCGVTQKILSDLVHTSPSTINKMVSSLELKPLDETASRNIRYSIDDIRSITSKFIANKDNRKCNVLSFYNFKGGVGKTTLCFEVASHLALMGYEVLAVDTDPQAHLSTALSFDTTNEYPTLYDIIVNDLSPFDCIENIFPGLDCLPSNLSLTRLESELDNLPRREERVSISLTPLKEKYDFIIFDCNPTISKLNMNIINFSDILPIIVETQLFAINGLKMLLQDLEKFCKKMIMDMPKIVVIPNKYEERTASSGEAMSLLRKYYSEYTIPDFAVRMSEELKTSTKLSLPLALFCRSNSIAFEDILEVLRYLLAQSKEEVEKSAAAY